MLTRLDFFRSDGPGFWKPRRGVCGLCGRPVIEHHTWSHRWQAARAIFLAHR